MNVNHLISDTVTRIKNGFIGHKNSISVLKSKQILSLINVLEEEGFIKGYTEGKYTLNIWLKYVEGASVIQNIKVVSKPSKRVYFSIPDLIDWRNKINTFDILILSTTQGILTDKVALEKGIGGEILCIIK
jgi:small subunit ribosomal protein S8